MNYIIFPTPDLDYYFFGCHFSPFIHYWLPFKIIFLGAIVMLAFRAKGFQITNQPNNQQTNKPTNQQPTNHQPTPLTPKRHTHIVLETCCPGLAIQQTSSLFRTQ